MSNHGGVTDPEDCVSGDWQTDERGSLTGVDVEAGEAKCSGHGYEDCGPREPSGSARSFRDDGEKDNGGSHAEAHEVAQRVELFSEVGVSFEETSAETIEEVGYSGDTDAYSGPLPGKKISARLEAMNGDENCGDTGDEVDASDRIGDIFDDWIHVFKGFRREGRL